MFEIDAHRAAAPVQEVLRWRLHFAARNRLGPVDPDDLGAHIAQHHGGERAGTDPCDLDDPVAGERSWHVGAPSGGLTRSFLDLDRLVKRGAVWPGPWRGWTWGRRPWCLSPWWSRPWWSAPWWGPWWGPWWLSVRALPVSALASVSPWASPRTHSGDHPRPCGRRGRCRRPASRR